MTKAAPMGLALTTLLACYWSLFGETKFFVNNFADAVIHLTALASILLVIFILTINEYKTIKVASLIAVIIGCFYISVLSFAVVGFNIAYWERQSLLSFLSFLLGLYILGAVHRGKYSNFKHRGS